MTLHILPGGFRNNDKRWLERASKNARAATMWTTPKGVQPGDEAVLFIGNEGFFATARVLTTASPRDGWPNRYWAKIGSIRLIAPSISLPMIRRALPELTWAIYPRSITTPPDHVAEQLRQLIRHRRTTKLPELSEEALQEASLEELRSVALMKSAPARGITTVRVQYLRAVAVKKYVLARADGYCEGCREPAPFVDSCGKPYLEPHHIHRLADEGPDHPKNVVAVCPNCHRRAHHSKDADDFKKRLVRVVGKLERDRSSAAP